MCGLLEFLIVIDAEGLSGLDCSTQSANLGREVPGIYVPEDDERRQPVIFRQAGADGNSIEL